MQRYCIDPLDPECPAGAPNFYSSACEAIETLEKISLSESNQTLDKILGTFMETPIKRKQQEPTSALDILGAFCEHSFYLSIFTNI
jgi:hypothetical protein